MYKNHHIQYTAALSRCFLVLLCLFGLPVSALGAENLPPLARQGQLDLSHWNWEQDGTIKLNGQWEFYWNQLLTPEEFSGPKPVRSTGWISVPGAWNGHTVDGRKLEGAGYATFRLRVLLPGPGQRLAMHIPYESTAYRLWANGRVMAANGVVGMSPGQSSPQYLPVTFSLEPEGRVLDLVVQVSNFHHRRGGIWNSILLGPEHQVMAADNASVAVRALLFGVLLATGLYHLLIYRLESSAASSMYFGLLTLLMAVKTAVTGQLLLMRFLPHFPWSALLTAEYLSFALGLPLFFLFLRSLYPEEVPRVLTRAAIWLGGLLTARTLLLPTMLTSQLIILDQILSQVFGFCALIVLSVAARNGRNHAPLFLGSCALWLGTIINDILYATGAPSAGAPLTPVGMLGFVIGMTLIMANQHTAAFHLQAELASHNTELAGTLKRNLEELREARRVLASQDEKLRKHIAESLHGRVQNRLLLAQLHLARIRESLQPAPVHTAEQLAEVETRLESLREEEIRRLSHLLHPAIVSIGLIPAVEELAEEYERLLDVVVQVDPELARLDDPLQGRIAESIRLTVYRVLAEALQNSLAHGAARSAKIELMLSADAARIDVRLSDDGCGFDPEQVRIGLGLQTIGARVTDSGGTWEMQSCVGAGTTLVFSMPLNSVAHTSDLALRGPA